MHGVGDPDAGLVDSTTEFNYNNPHPQTAKTSNLRLKIKLFKFTSCHNTMTGSSSTLRSGVENSQQQRWGQRALHEQLKLVLLVFGGQRLKRCQPPGKNQTMPMQKLKRLWKLLCSGQPVRGDLALQLHGQHDPGPLLRYLLKRSQASGACERFNHSCGELSLNELIYSLSFQG